MPSPWVGTVAWNGTDAWSARHAPARDTYLTAELVSDGVTEATLTGGPALTAVLLDDGVTFASLVDEPSLAVALLV